MKDSNKKTRVSSARRKTSIAGESMEKWSEIQFVRAIEMIWHEKQSECGQNKFQK